jgi:uncharacterized membrane protein YfcA
VTTDPLILLSAGLTALAAGAVNSIAGGGTLLTFPMLIWAGIDGKTANATSTIGLWAGSLGGAWGYRKDLQETGSLFWPFFFASLAGGCLGSYIFLRTGSQQFDAIVPWLILTATLLFASQSIVKRFSRSHHETQLLLSRWPIVVGVQFGVGVYGGYFGAGMGILMLAVLAFLGLSNIHLMNGIKNVAATVINGVTIVIFVAASQMQPEWIKIDWPLALVMAVSSSIGGYACAGWARRLGPVLVRRIVIFIGLAGAAGTAYKLWFTS